MVMRPARITKTQTCLPDDGWLPTLAPPPALILTEPDPPPPPDMDALWHRFYRAYPRHTAPRAGRLAFDRIIRNGEATIDDLIQGAIRYAEHCARRGTAPQYIAHPATWINGGQWANEYGAPVAASTSSFARVGAAFRDAARHGREGVRGAARGRGLDAADD